MALTLSATMRSAIADAVDTAIGTTGTLEFQTSGDVKVAGLTLGNPAFGAAATGVITLSGTPLSDTNAAGGTMAKFKIFSNTTSPRVLQITGTVGTSASDINFSAGVVVTAGDTVQLTSFTITCPAS
jgi:hypothetical protein